MFHPQVTPSRTYRDMTDVFEGYNHKLKIADGQMWDMENLTGEFYPLLSSRKKRGTAASGAMQGVIAKDAIAFIRNGKLWYNNLETSVSVSQPTVYTAEPENPITGDYWYQNGVTKQWRSSSWHEVTYPSKQLVSMGAYLLIFPDRIWYNTADGTSGSMDASFTAGDSATISYSITRLNGDDIDLGSATVGSTPPANPNNGDYWIDTSGSFDVLNQYSSLSASWVQVPTVYTRISATNIGKNFSQYDGVTIAGASYTAGSQKLADEIAALNGNKVIYECGDDFITVAGLISAEVTQTGGVSVERTVPDMDYVCESGNRLWGCKYGLKDGTPINELYGSALGDFKNWNKFMGLSTDSWAASCGSDGEWTGAVNFFGNPTFFKEDHIHQISVSSSGAHQVTDWAARGVQKGSWKSLAIVGETLFYKSRQSVCAYQGGLPIDVSDALGDVHYEEASAGVFGNILYISMRSGVNWSLFTFDTIGNRWYKEDATHCIGFASADDDIFAVTPSSLIALRGTQGTLESTLSWSATSGVLYYQYPDQKYVSRYNLRLRMPQGATGKIYIQYDSSGIWEEQGNIVVTGLNSITVPIRPRRCDHLQVKITGTGDLRLFSIARVLEIGSDY